MNNNDYLKLQLFLMILMVMALLVISLPELAFHKNPVIFFSGDLVSRSSLGRANKVVKQIDKLIGADEGKEVIVASTGDNEQEAYPSVADYVNGFGATYRTFLDRGIFRQVRGNHDVEDNNNGVNYAEYFGKNSHLDSNGMTNYSYNLGNWHIVALDQTTSAANERTLAFLKKDLKENESYKCQIVYWHVPVYSSGITHGDSPELKPLLQTAYDAGVEVIVNGHDHDYQRFWPMNPEGKRDNKKGVTIFIDGIGGEAGRIGKSTSAAELASAVYLDKFNDKDAIGTIMFNLFPAKAEYQLYDANSGKILDSGEIRCK